MVEKKTREEERREGRGHEIPNVLITPQLFRFP
jgi:hypothetical protein